MPKVHVGNWPNTSRVMGLVCVMPLTVYLNVPVLRSVKVSVPLPTTVPRTCVGRKGTELKGGPVSLNSVPV